MARRFTDTGKWIDEWYGSLSNDHRIIWQYLLDNCSNAGIFKKDWRLLRFQCNTTITEDQFKEVFKGRVIDRGHFFFIPKFLKYQNKTGLNSNKPAVIAIREELIQNNLIQIVRQSLGNDFLIIKGIGKGTGEGEGTYEGKGKPTLQEIKDKVYNELFSDELYIESLQMTHRGKDIKTAFDECYIHHSNAPNPPADVGGWKQKLNTWLINTKQEKTKQPKKEISLDELNKLRRP